MKCPICTSTDLMMTDRQGIEIDYCPQCRGVWLDRGELDKIIERSSQQPAAPPPQAHHAPGPNYPPPPQSPHHGYGHDDHRHGYGHSQYHKKKSFLTELFDFD